MLMADIQQKRNKMNKSMKITEKTRAILRKEKNRRETSDTFVSMTSLMEEAVKACFDKPEPKLEGSV